MGDCVLTFDRAISRAQNHTNLLLEEMAWGNNGDLRAAVIEPKIKREKHTLID